MPRLCAALLSAALLLTTAGCGFAEALADPEAAQREAAQRLAAERVAAEQAAAATPAAPTVAVPAAPTGPVVVLQAQLTGPGSRAAGQLTVTLGEPRTGWAPPVPNFSDTCPVDAAGLHQLPLEFRFEQAGSVVPGFAAELTVTAGPASPADTPDIGVFVESADPDEPACDGRLPLPGTDRYWNFGGRSVIDGYVVLADAVTPATPDGRPEVFPTLELRVGELRLFSDPEAQRSLTIGQLTVGAPCPDDEGALCAPLG